MSESPKRLIEVNFPLPEVSAASISERGRSGHISSLHTWWARRPLAASRATALAALLPDPGDDVKRREILELVRDIAPWEVVSKDTPQNLVLLERARKLILNANDGNPPKVLDCFAGGGAIPLEALRLGCETYAVDYNPVAVLILKCVLEFPMRFGKLVPSSNAPKYGLPARSERDSLGLEKREKINPLAEAVKYWGRWMLEGARKKLEPFYPKDKDGGIPVGYIWAHTLPCQNAECGAVIPLMRSLWLANRGDEKVAFQLHPNKISKQIEGKIEKGSQIRFDPEQGTVKGGSVDCPICPASIGEKDARLLFQKAKAGQRMMVVVLRHPNSTENLFRPASMQDYATYQSAERELLAMQESLGADWQLSPIPDEPLTRERPSPNARGLSALAPYRMQRWSDLFNLRQQLTLVTFAHQLRLAYRQMLSKGADNAFAKAVATYLALALDKLAVRLCVLTRWRSDTRWYEAPFGRPALAMVWDFCEVNPLSESTDVWDVESTVRVIEHLNRSTSALSTRAHAEHGNATHLPWAANYFDAVLTDPPYYDNVPYSDLADFFYVWLKRAVGDLYPGLFSTPLTPKTGEIVWHQRHGGSYEAGKAFFEKEINAAFMEVDRVLKPNGIAVIVFAHKTTEAWEKVITALLKAGLYMTGSWPIHTEMQARLNAQETASLASSIYMICRKRTGKEIAEFPKVRLEIEKRVRQQLAKFWQEGIRGADFFMSAIGPAVEVFGRYERVEKLSGEPVSVAELLDYVEKVVSEFALERILGSAELGGVDPETRFYLLWRWTYNHARVKFDEARKLATAVGTEVTALWGPGQLASKEKEFVRVLGPKDREKDKKFLNQVGYSTMVDALHRACIHWERGERRQLKEHLGQTYGANNIFWRVAQNIADVLPAGDKEKQLLQGLLNIPEARTQAPAGTGKLFAE